MRLAAVLNNAGTTTGVGRAFFYQEEANTDVIFTTTAMSANLAAGGPFTIEIRISVNCAATGPIYNPLGVSIGLFIKLLMYILILLIVIFNKDM